MNVIKSSLYTNTSMHFEWKNAILNFYWLKKMYIICFRTQQEKKNFKGKRTTKMAGHLPMTRGDAWASGGFVTPNSIIIISYKYIHIYIHIYAYEKCNTRFHTLTLGGLYLYIRGLKAIIHKSIQSSPMVVNRAQKQKSE